VVTGRTQVIAKSKALESPSQMDSNPGEVGEEGRRQAPGDWFYTHRAGLWGHGRKPPGVLRQPEGERGLQTGRSGISHPMWQIPSRFQLKVGNKQKSTCACGTVDGRQYSRYSTGYRRNTGEEGKQTQGRHGPIQGPGRSICQCSVSCQAGAG
jgi:hypothetical protein